MLSLRASCRFTARCAHGLRDVPSASIKAYEPTASELGILASVAASGAAFSHPADSRAIAAMRRAELARLKLNGLLRSYRGRAASCVLETTPAGLAAIKRGNVQ